jgi:hypothetical protein
MPKNTNTTLHMMMHEYLAAHNPVTPIPEKNAIILDGPETLLTRLQELIISSGRNVRKNSTLQNFLQGQFFHRP